MTDQKLGIGALARASGLGVSALRFYDGAGVLRPARVDPVTGYRWYDAAQVEPARLVAALRRVAMPLDDIRAVLADPTAASTVLDGHLRRLEDGLADARRHLGVAHDLLAGVGRCVVRGADLAAARAAVRHAVGRFGVLFEVDGTGLHLVATDRYRLARASVPIRSAGPGGRAVAPPSFLDALPRLRGDVEVTIGPDAITVGATRTAVLGAAFPAYEPALRRHGGRRVTVAAADLRRRLVDGPTRTVRRSQDGTDHEVSALRVEGDRVTVVAAAQPGTIGVNRGFLLDALAAGRSSELGLTLAGPQRPLMLSSPRTTALVMPVLL